MRYELAMMARTCTNNLRVVLSPYYNIAHVRPWSKNGPQKLNSKARRFSVFVCQNWMKNGQVMTMGSARGKVALSYFGP